MASGRALLLIADIGGYTDLPYMLGVRRRRRTAFAHLSRCTQEVAGSSPASSISVVERRTRLCIRRSQRPSKKVVITPRLSMTLMRPLPLSAM
jgi:hypothetical protein